MKKQLLVVPLRAACAAGARIDLETLKMYLLREPDARRTTIEISKRNIPIASLRLDEASELGRILTGMVPASRV